MNFKLWLWDKLFYLGLTSKCFYCKKQMKPYYYDTNIYYCEDDNCKLGRYGK